MTAIQSSNVPPYLNDQTTFSKSLVSLASAKSLSVDSKGNLIPTGLLNNLFQGGSVTSDPRLVELKVMEFLIHGKKWLQPSDIKLVNQLSRQAGLLPDSTTSANDHKELSLLVDLIAKEVRENEAVSLNDCKDIFKAFQTRYRNILKPYSDQCAQVNKNFAELFPIQNENAEQEVRESIGEESSSNQQSQDAEEQNQSEAQNSQARQADILPDSKTAVNEEGAETVAPASPLPNTKEGLTKIMPATRRNRKRKPNDNKQQLIKNAALAALTTAGGLGALFLGYRKLYPAKVTPVTPITQDPSLLTDDNTKKITEKIIDTATGTVNDILNKNPAPHETPLTTASSSVVSTALIVGGVAIAVLIVIGTGVYFVRKHFYSDEEISDRQKVTGKLLYYLQKFRDLPDGLSQIIVAIEIEKGLNDDEIQDFLNNEPKEKYQTPEIKKYLVDYAKKTASKKLEDYPSIKPDLRNRAINIVSTKFLLDIATNLKARVNFMAAYNKLVRTGVEDALAFKLSAMIVETRTKDQLKKFLEKNLKEDRIEALKNEYEIFKTTKIIQKKPLKLIVSSQTTTTNLTSTTSTTTTTSTTSTTSTTITNPTQQIEDKEKSNRQKGTEKLSYYLDEFMDIPEASAREIEKGLAAYKKLRSYNVDEPRAPWADLLSTMIAKTRTEEQLQQFLNEELTPEKVQALKAELKIRQSKLPAGLINNYVKKTPLKELGDLLLQEGQIDAKIQELKDEFELLSNNEKVRLVLEDRGVSNDLIERALNTLPTTLLMIFQQFDVENKYIEELPKLVTVHGNKQKLLPKLKAATLSDDEANRLAYNLAVTLEQDKLDQILNEDFTQEGRLEALKEMFSKAEISKKFKKVTRPPKPIVLSQKTMTNSTSTTSTTTTASTTSTTGTITNPTSLADKVTTNTLKDEVRVMLKHVIPIKKLVESKELIEQALNVFPQSLLEVIKEEGVPEWIHKDLSGAVAHYEYREKVLPQLKKADMAEATVDEFLKNVLRANSQAELEQMLNFATIKELLRFGVECETKIKTEKAEAEKLEQEIKASKDQALEMLLAADIPKGLEQEKIEKELEEKLENEKALTGCKTNKHKKISY